VTGVGGSSTNVFLAGNKTNSSGPETITRCYPLPLTSALSFATYINEIDPVDIFDIAYDGEANGSGEIWAATDDADSPVKCYAASGSASYAIDGSLISAARGMAFYTEGTTDCIWVSNPDDDRIYLVDIYGTGMEGEGSPSIDRITLSASCNPFSAAVTISSAAALDDAVIEVFDISGRNVLESSFNGSFNWNACNPEGIEVPAGHYCVRVRDADGRSGVLNVVKL